MFLGGVMDVQSANANFINFAPSVRERMGSETV